MTIKNTANNAIGDNTPEGKESLEVPLATALPLDDVESDKPMASAARPFFAAGPAATAIMTQAQYTVTPIDTGLTPAYLKVHSPVEQPSKITVTREGDKWILRRKWRGAEVFPLTCFTIFWTGFMVMWNTIAIVTGAWAMAIFGIIHDAVAVYLIRCVLVSILNSTFVTIEGGKLDVTHRPFRSGMDVSLACVNIREIVCKRNVHTSSKGHISTTFTVLHRDDNNAEHVIVEGLPYQEEALFIEQEIEKELGIGALVNSAL